MDKNQLKNDGFLFGRNLQRALKITSIYASTDHSAADMAAQQVYASLNPLLKNGGEFTLGFMNNRLLLNNILTGENPLTVLEAEFTKRGIGRVTFVAGITLEEFKQGLAALSTTPKALEKAGGLKRLLAQTPLRHMRIVPAARPQGEGEDTVLSGGSESYLLAQAILEPQAGKEQAGLALMLQSAGVETPLGFAPFSGNVTEIHELAGKAIQRVLADPERDLPEAVTALTDLFKKLTPDHLLASLIPGKRNASGDASAEGLVAELVENTAVELAGKRVANSAQEPLDPTVIEDVTKVLARGLKATRVAERLLQKLARFIEDAKLPAEINDRIRQEFMWITLPEQEKHAELLRVERFGDRDFRHLVNYIHDRTKEGNTDLALEVTSHYLACVNRAPAEVGVEQLARVHEVLRAVAPPATPEFIRALADRLCPQLLDESHSDQKLHGQIANCLTHLAQSAALYEDFKFVRRIGADLQNSLRRAPAKHTDCCGQALQSLLTPSVADRLVALYLENRDDTDWARTAANLLRLPGGVGGARAFERLAEEPVASNRMRLLRLIGQLGPSVGEVARKKLTDKRWYVVRNACCVLGRLGDRDLSSELRAALRHPDVRVQQEVFTAIIRKQVANRAEVLAEALTDLKAHVLDMTLDELILLRDHATVEAVEQFILQKKGGRDGSLEKAVKVLAAIPSDRAAEALSRVLSDTGQTRSVRRAALVALSCSTSPHAQRLMHEFCRLDPKDQLVVECQSLLSASQP